MLAGAPVAELHLAGRVIAGLDELFLDLLVGGAGERRDDGLIAERVREYLREAKLPSSGKSPLLDGRTGEKIDQEVVVGYIYMMKLNHLVSHKIHARAVGP